MRIKHISFWLVIGTLLATPAQAECRLTSSDQCQGFLAEQSDQFALQKGLDFYQRIVAQIDACRGNTDFERLCGQCTTNIARFAKSQINFRSHGMGMNVPNTQYLDAQNEAHYEPEMMSIPSELMVTRPITGSATPRWSVESFPLMDMLARDFADEAWQALAQKGWKHAVYASRTVPNPPFDSMRRLLVFIPGPQYDRWIQFTLPDITRPNTAEVLVDFIAAQKTDRAGVPLPKVHLHFRQYTRLYERDSTVVTGLERRDRTKDKCFSCHPSGMRPLSPDPGSFLGQGQSANILAMNQIMNNYGPVTWGETLVPEDHGPALGRDSGCTRCHAANAQRPPLPWTLYEHGEQMGIRTIHHKIVEDMTMPPDRSFDVVRDMMTRLAAIDFSSADERNNFAQTMRTAPQSAKYPTAFAELVKHGRLLEEQKAKLEDLTKRYQRDAKANYETFTNQAPDEVRAWFQATRCE